MAGSKHESQKCHGSQDYSSGNLLVMCQKTSLEWHS